MKDARPNLITERDFAQARRDAATIGQNQPEQTLSGKELMNKDRLRLSGEAFEQARQKAYATERSATEGTSHIAEASDFKVGFMKNHIAEARRHDLPLTRLSADDAALIAKTLPNLTPGEMHFLSKSLLNSGRLYLGFGSELTGEDRQALDYVKGGGKPLYKANLGMNSPFGNLITQGEGRESVADGRDVIKLGRHTTLDEFNGRPQDKTYRPYRDKDNLLNIGPGVRLYDDEQHINELATLNLLPHQIKDGKIERTKGSDLNNLTGAQMEKLFGSRARKAAAEVEKAMPFVGFLGDYQQAVAISMAYNMGAGGTDTGRGLKSFRKFIEHASNGDFYNAGLEMLRSQRSEDVKGRNLWEALVFLTDGDSNLTGERRLDYYKKLVDNAFEEDRKKDNNKTYAEIMEELYISEAIRLGYGHKTE